MFINPINPTQPIRFYVVVIIPLFLLSQSLFGQQTPTDTIPSIPTDTTTTHTRVDFGDLEEIEIQEGGEDGEEGTDDKENRTHFDIQIGASHWRFEDGTDLRLGLFDMGFSTYMSENSLNLPAELDQYELLYDGSLNLNFHLVRHRVPVIKDHASFEYGLSFSFMTYKFANDFKIVPNQPTFQTVSDGTAYKKNKLKTTFLEVPLLFTITPGRRKSFYLSGGGYAGLLLNAKQKLKTEAGEKTKIKDDFNLNKFRYGLVGRIGVGPIAFYVQYALNDLFKEGQGPALRPFNVGITVLNF